MRFIALNKASHADFHPNGLIKEATMSDAYTLIQNGLIIDGTRSDPFPDDVLIGGQRIGRGRRRGRQCPADATVKNRCVRMSRDAGHDRQPLSHQF